MTLLSGPNINGNEWKYVKDCLDTAWVSSVGQYVNSFEEMMAVFTGCKYAVATSSGTTALHISLLLAGVQERDYVLVPNVTFVASLNSIAYTGASPLLIDIEASSWQMDLNLLESFLKANTTIVDGVCVHIKDKRVIRAIMPVHVLGNMLDMDKLLQLAVMYHLIIIEDATEALGSYYNGKHSGSFGSMGCFSFNGNKIITTGGGGMIVTNDESLARKAKHLTTQAKSDPFEYIHDEIGYNYRMVNVLAAIGVAQMEQLPTFIKRKKEIDRLYKTLLSGVGDISFQEVKTDVDANCWLFTFRTTQQQQVLKTLNDYGFQSRPFWKPMNQLRMFNKEHYVQNENVSQVVYTECLSIPCSTYLHDDEIIRITELIKTNYCL